jgi:hypothetical protein
MTWQVDLVGDLTDVSELDKLAPLFNCSVQISPDGRPCLTGLAFCELSGAAEARAKAAHIVAVLNGILRMQYGNHRPVKLGNAVSQTTPGGARQISLLLPVEEIRMRVGTPRMTVLRADGNTEAVCSGDNADRRARAVIGRPDLCEIAVVLSNEVSWQRLRVAFEKVSTLIGGGDNALVKRGFATQAELNRFKANVQDPRLSGMDAVHGISRGRLKGSKMGVEDGLAFVVKMLDRYLESET